MKTKFKKLLYLIPLLLILSCHRADENEEIKQPPFDATKVEAISEVIKELNVNEGLNLERVNALLKSKYDIDFADIYNHITGDPAFMKAFGAHEGSTLRVSADPKSEIEKALEGINGSILYKSYIWEIIQLIPDNADEGANLTVESVLNNLHAIEVRFASDAKLIRDEKDKLLMLNLIYRENLGSIVSLIERQLTNDDDISNLRTKGWLKRTWRKTRSILGVAIIGAAMGATINPVAAIVGAVIGVGLAVLDMSLNNRCRFAMQCAGGWSQNCMTGECMVGPEDPGGGGYGGTIGGGTQPGGGLKGPRTLNRTPVGANCRNCGGENYENIVDVLDLNFFTEQTTQTPPFSILGAVDMSKAPASSAKNELGWPRNSKYFWENYTDPHGALSQNNRDLIALKRTPIVDAQWKAKMPGESDAIIGEVIEHHHVNKGRYAIPRALSLHRLSTWYKNLHPKFVSSIVFVKNKTIFGRTGKTMIGTLNIFAQVYDVIKTAFSNDPQTMTNTIYSYVDGGVMHPPISGFKEGRVYYIQSEDVYIGIDALQYDSKGQIILMRWTLYQNYGYDNVAKEYIGIGVINNGQIGSYLRCL